MSQEELPEEYELFRRIGEGDSAAFEEFYDKFAGVIYSTCLGVLQDVQDAEDVAQEVFTMIWEKAKIYDPQRGKPLTWAITMARNKAIDKLRSLRRRFRLNEEIEKRGNWDSWEDAQPWAGMEEIEDSDAIRRAIEKLNAKQREVLEMAFFSGMTQVEIAAKLGEPLGTIKARIRRALLKLRQSVRAARNKGLDSRN